MRPAFYLGRNGTQIFADERRWFLSMDLSTLTLTELREALRRGETTSVAATQAVLDRIVAVDNELNSYLTITDEMALEQAAAADARRQKILSARRGWRRRPAEKSWKVLSPLTTPLSCDS
jgi:hypothetical protein